MKSLQSIKKLCIGIVIMFLYLSLISTVYAESSDDKDMTIKLQSVKFDPMISIPTKEPANLFMISDPQGKESYIIQFTGPVKDEYKKQISDLGVIFYGYVPNYAFIVRMDDNKREKVESLSFVRWVGFYHPFYRISPNLLDDMEIDETSMVNVLIFDVDKDVIASKIMELGGDILFSSNKNIHILIDNARLPEIASINEVMWIEKYVEPELYNNESASIMNIDPIVWDTHGLSGTGQIIAVADSGLDTGDNDATMHDDFEGNINNIHSWPIQPKWNLIINNDGANDGASDQDSGHGTHVAGSVLGDGTRSGGDIKGMGYNADLVFQAIEQYVDFNALGIAYGYSDGYYLFGIPNDLNDLFQEAYGDGARIHTNSWGSPVEGEYNENANEADTFIWNHKDILILFSAGNSGTDSNSDGVVDYDSMGSPGTAKNVITVGGSENLRSGGFQGTYYDAWSVKFPANPIRDDHLSDDFDGMVAFSSRGPCDDGRIKPDVVAPGTNILSTKSSLISGSGWGPYDAHYMYMGGTSMSTPLTAGTAALVREYYIDIRSHTPSAALMKATLINGAFDMPGQYSSDETDGPTPNCNSGWGRVDLANSIYPDTRAILFSDSDVSLSTGESQSFNYEVTDDSVPLKISLVWTDYPASVPSGGGIVNNLNLIVTDPDGVAYNGNDFTDPYDSSVDNTNNVEQVRINTPTNGIYEITIEAPNIPDGPQDFAFVISGGFGAHSLDPLTLIKEDNIIDCVEPEDEIIYTINYNNPNNEEVHNVVITDDLSSDVAYVSSNGVYDGTTVTWTIGTVGANSGGSCQLTVSVNSGTAIDINNCCTIDSDETVSTEACEETQLCGHPVPIISGWNLISAPMNLNTWELGQESIVGDPLNVTPKNSLASIYRYNTTSELFEMCIHHEDWGWDTAIGSESFTELEPGRGYWVVADNGCTLTFTGTAPSDMDISLNAGWNCVGWYSTYVAELGQESLVVDPFDVTPDNSLASVYMYNTTSKSFEMCIHHEDWGWDTAIGSESFTELEPGKGYWVMADNDCEWNHET
jgi:uncharacterized repeat protein (TIGR01451 family)